MKNENYKRKYDSVEVNGNTIYTSKNKFSGISKYLNKKGASIDSEVRELKTELEDAVNHRKKISKEALNPKIKAEVGDQYHGRMEDLKITNKRIKKAVAGLSKLNCLVDPIKLAKDVVVYMKEGHDNMLRIKDIKSMKLDIFEENAQGKISDELRDYMLVTLESVAKDIERTEAYFEAVNNIISNQRNNFVNFVTEAYNEGLISNRQHEVMLEMAEDDFLFEAPTPERIPELVEKFLEAAEEGNEDKKEAIKEQINTANELKKISSGEESEEDVVTEGADCSIREKLESLKIKLSDEEKEMAERFDEMIVKATSEEGASDDKKTEDTPSDNKTKENEKEEENEESNDDSKKKKDDDVKEEPVKESFIESIENFFNNVALESSISDEEANSIRDYVRESVNDSIYTEEDAARIERALSLR